MVEVYRAEASEWRFTPPAECAERLGGYVDVYTNAACKYPYAEDVYLMLPSFLYHWECVEVVRGEGDEAGDMHVNFPDTSDIRLLTSRDGVSWEQAPGRRPFLRVGLKGGSKSRQLYTAPGFVRVGDSLWNYCSGSNRNHSGLFDPESDGIKYGIYVNESRLDGFISADAPYEGGWLVTPPITFEGEQPGAQRRHKRGGYGLCGSADRGRFTHRWVLAGGLRHHQRQFDADGGHVPGQRRPE